jgi:hypothetical protein
LGWVNAGTEGRSAFPGKCPSRINTISRRPALHLSSPLSLFGFGGRASFCLAIPFLLNRLIIFLDEYGTHPVTWVVIASRYPRLPSLSRHCDENPVTVTPLLSHPYKCPIPQTLSFDTLTNARGVWGSSSLPAFPRSRRAAFLLCAPFLFKYLRTLLLLRGRGVLLSTVLSPLGVQRSRSSDVPPIFRPVFSIAYALFQVPYPASPLPATLTKTAGCIPTIPILERVRPACSCRPLLRAPRVTFCSQGSIRGWQHSLF